MRKLKHATAPILTGILLAAALFSAGQACAKESFKSPDAAFTALVDAAKSRDRGAVVKLLGPEARDIINSGDSVADKAARDKFLAEYDKKHRIVQKGDEATLVIGDDGWPFPIPVAEKDGAWTFNTKEGHDEILRRRIGRNELSALKVIEAYVVAQHDYVKAGAGGPDAYAQKILSTPGKKDGLYWPTKAGEPQSPLGPLIAEAAAEGYKAHRNPIPYHGYFYRVLKRQGKDAPGGAKTYLADGKMTGGFALIAYPAQYGNSGIMTFMVNQQGVIYQKDLGAKTSKIAQEVQSYSPGHGWTKAE